MADKYYMFDSKSINAEKSCEDEDFDEEEVWSVLKEKEDKTASPKYTKLKGSSSASSKNPRYLPSSSKINTNSVQHSAPINIPGVMYKKNIDEDDGVVDDDKVPPHEWIANKLAKSEISSSSVYEGVGRTLKGRDLSKVRNDVLSKTGFLE